MENARASTCVKLLRWGGRIIGLAASAFFLFFLIGEWGSDGTQVQRVDRTLLLFLPFLLAAVCGSVVGLFRERVGGTITLIAGLSMGVFHLMNGGMGDLDTALIFGLPFMLSGAALLYYGYFAARRKRRSIPPPPAQ